MPQRHIFEREAELARTAREQAAMPPGKRWRLCGICGDRLDADNACAHVRKLGLFLGDVP